MAIRRWTWLLVPLLLAGCNGTPLGDQLSSSFSPGSAGPASGGPAASAPANGGQGTPAASSAPPPTAAVPARPGGPVVPPGSAAPPTPPTAPPAAPARTTPATPPRPAAPQPSTPAPYRVTIKLPAADPSAPAEAVTRALRSAGLTFEVETIERVPSPGANRAGATPAPATR